MSLTRQQIKSSLVKGKKIIGGVVDVRVKKEEEKGRGGCSFVVLKNTTKNAVERNLLKRRARNIIKKNQNFMKGGFSIVFLFKAGASDVSFEELEKKMIKELKKEKIYEENSY